MSVAVVLMAYGSPDRLEDVPAYYADIRGGRPIRPELLEELVERYRSLGVGREAVSPLNAVTEEQRAALERELGLPVVTGMRHWRPHIAEAAEQALATGARTVVGLVLAPHYSAMSIGAYRRQLEEAIGDRADLRFVDRWGDEPGLVELWAEKIVAQSNYLSSHVVFTAHSLPARVAADGDPYADELMATSRAIAQRAALSDWSFSFQSESATGEPWLGPDILDHLRELAAAGVRDVIVCPIGFVSEHLEIRWDLDVEAAALARELGLRLRRLEMPNAEPAFIEVLAALVRRAAPVPSVT
jgi:ferrochelatase